MWISKSLKSHKRVWNGLDAGSGGAQEPVEEIIRGSYCAGGGADLHLSFQRKYIRTLTRPISAVCLYSERGWVVLDFRGGQRRADGPIFGFVTKIVGCLPPPSLARLPRRKGVR